MQPTPSKVQPATARRGQPWAAHDLQLLRERYPHEPTAALAARLGRPVGQVYQAAARHGLRKSAEYLSSPAACRLRRGDAVGKPWQFRPGMVPWNKGLAGSTGLHPATAAHHFTPGNRPHTWRPVGSTRVSKDGYLQRKRTDTGYPPRDWVAVHRTVWEAAHGPVPAGSVVVFRPGRLTQVESEITLDAIECVTRRELMARNSVHRHGSEIYRAAQLRGAITRQINRRLREQQELEEAQA
jgi:hypothetical protein